LLLTALVPDLLKLRSDQTDSVSVDLHQQRLNGDGRLLSFGRTCGRLRRRKIKSRHSGILRHRRQSAQELSLVDADWPTASDGKEPLAAVGRTGALDPKPSETLLPTGHKKSIEAAVHIAAL